jgi:hypothetical protein
MKDDDLDRIEAAARAATPGPWHVEHDELGWVNRIYHCEPDDWDPSGQLSTTLVETDSGVYPPRVNDATHIATADPPTVLALVAEVRELRAQRQALATALGSAEEGKFLEASEVIADMDKRWPDWREWAGP